MLQSTTKYIDLSIIPRPDTDMVASGWSPGRYGNEMHQTFLSFLPMYDHTQSVNHALYEPDYLRSLWADMG